MRILVIDSALARSSVAVVAAGQVVVQSSDARVQGHEAVLPVLAQGVMREAGSCIELIAVSIGPGSFTGIRAGLALAHGIGLALGVPVIGVTEGEAIADALPHLGGRSLWVVTSGRHGKVFLEQAGGAASVALDNLPLPPGRVAIAGGAANQVAASLAARGMDVMLTDARFALPRHIAAVAARRYQGLLPPRQALPLYVDPPEAKLPADGLRPLPGTEATEVP